jgi:hypothetical protein
MYLLIINGSENKYSHEMGNIYTKLTLGNENPYMRLVRDYQNHFAGGNLTCLQIIVQKIDNKTGVVEVLHNEYAERPVAVRTELNVAAREASALRRARKTEALMAHVFAAPEAQLFADEPAEEDEE